MSRTDKTRPYWVQVRDPDFPYELRAIHRAHGSHECDIDFPLPTTRQKRFTHCEWWPAYDEYDKIWGRGRYRRSREFKQDKRARADLRRLRSKWLKDTDRANIDSNENLPTQRWLWRRWYWD